MRFWEKPEDSSDWSKYPNSFIATIWEGKQSAGLYYLAYREQREHEAKIFEQNLRKQASALGV